jgi:hypothetical protein
MRASTSSSARSRGGYRPQSSSGTLRGCATEVFTLLERHQTAYVVMSGAGLSCVLRATAPTVHLRLHGPDDQWLYSGSYPDEDLRWGRPHPRLAVPVA